MFTYGWFLSEAFFLHLRFAIQFPLPRARWIAMAAVIVCSAWPWHTTSLETPKDPYSPLPQALSDRSLGFGRLLGGLCRALVGRDLVSADTSAKNF